MHHALFFLAIFASLLLLPTIWRLTFSLWTSIFQIYTIPLLGFYPSLALLSTFSLTPKLAKYKPTFTQIPLVILIALMMLQAISLLWAKNIHLGLATILYEMPFLILYVISFNVALDDPSKLLKLLKTYSVLSLIPLLVIIAFSINHNLDKYFLYGPLAKSVINPNSLSWYLTQYPGMEWPGKPNGFFTNSNVGAGYLGICVLLLWGIGSYCHSTWIKLIAVLHWITIFLTFSVAAIGLAFFIPLIMLFIYTLETKSILHTLLKSLKYFFAAALISLVTLFFKPHTLSLIAYKIKSRFIFWKVASTFFQSNVVLGLGFGGWDTYYEKYRIINPNILLWPHLPPHNTFLQLWTQSGILAAILGLLFMSSILWFSWQAFRILDEKRLKLYAICIIGGFLWVFLQGMGENWGVIGEMHMQPILAITFGLLMGLYYRKKNISSGSNTDA